MEAHGCDSAALGDVTKLREMFGLIVRDLDLHPIGSDAWHKFDGHGGVTGVTMLSESHLACHTFPEHRSMCLNLFCCRPRADWDFELHLKQAFGACTVHVRRIDRPYYS